MAQQQGVQARARLGQVRFSLLPSLYVDGSYTLNQYEITMDPSEWMPEEFSDVLGDDFEPTVIQEKDYLSASLRVEQSLFDARTLPGLKAAKENLASALATERRTERLMKAQVAQMAYAVQAAREATALSTRALSMAQVQLDLADARKELGGSARRDHLKAQLALSISKRDLHSAEEAEASVELAFSQLTGFDRDVPLTLSSSLQVPASLQEALSLAKAQRQDLEAARAAAASTRAVHRASRWSFMPRISATFLTSYTENTMFSDYPTSWMGIVNARWALWDGGRTRAQKTIDTATWRMAEDRALEMDERVAQDVESAWRGLRRASQAVEAVGIEVELAKENLALTEASLPTGGASWVDVEQARLALQAASITALRERTAYRMAQVNLLVATGQY